MSARLLADERWRELFDELRIALREVNELEPKVLDDESTQAEWTEAWAQYAGLLGRIAHLHQRLQSRRVELLGD